MEVLAQYPDVPSQLTGNQDLLTWQTWVIAVGAAGFTVLLLLLSASGIYKPKLAERVLRSYDVPPISGGPGKSRAGGFFVLMYIFAWTSFGICIFIQWAFFNEQARAVLVVAAVVVRRWHALQTGGRGLLPRRRSISVRHHEARGQQAAAARAAAA